MEKEKEKEKEKEEERIRERKVKKEHEVELQENWQMDFGKLFVVKVEHFLTEYKEKCNGGYKYKKSDT